MIDYGKSIKQKRKELGISQQEVADWLGLHRVTLGNYENKQHNISEVKLKKIEQFLNLKTAYEFYGTFRLDSFGMEYKALSNGEYLLNVPYIPVSLYDEYAATLEGGNFKLNHLIDQIDKGVYIAFEVKGEAMDNGSRLGLTKGDIAVAKEVDKNSIEMDKTAANIWVIILEDDILFRKMERVIKDESKILFKALNPSREFADFSLNISEIKKIYQVTQRRTNY